MNLNHLRLLTLLIVVFAHFGVAGALWNSKTHTQQLSVQPLQVSFVELPVLEPEIPAKPIQKPSLPAPQPKKRIPIPSKKTVSAATSQAPIVMALSDLIVRYQPAPIYPSLSKRMGEEGKVMIRLLINTHGRVERVDIMASSGKNALDQAALNAVKQWQFSPPPQTAWVHIPIIFKLEA